jgi:hypothetical protein
MRSLNPLGVIRFVLAAVCAALSALILKRMGQATEAEKWRAEAETGFRALGATRLWQRLREDWKAVRAPR